MVKMGFPNSTELFARACKIIPGGTNSGARNVIMGGTYDGYAIDYPKFVDRAKGSHLYDVDGHEYVDYLCGFGPIILGHAHPKVNDAVKQQMDRGSIYGLNTEVEIEVSEKMVKHVPGADMVRIMNTGSEVTSAAVRMARIYNRKEKVLKFEGHWHGWHDWAMPNHYFYADGTFLPPGIPLNVRDNTITIEWNDLDLLEKTLRRQGDEIAAVITEAHMFNSGVIPPEEGYLKGLRELTKKYDTVLIIDEIVTGFRFGLGGAQQYFGVTGDLATFAKCMANGFSIAALTGKREIMEKAGKVILGTYNANPLVTTAASATIAELETDPNYDHLYKIGRTLMKGIREVAQDAGVEVLVQGPGPGFGVIFTKLERIRNPRDLLIEKNYVNAHRNVVFVQEMLNRGIFLMPHSHASRWYVTKSHSEEDARKTIEAAGEALRVVKKVP